MTSLVPIKMTPVLPIKMKPTCRILNVIKFGKRKEQMVALFDLSREVWQIFGEARFPIAIIESPRHSSTLEQRGHANVVFKTKANDKDSHWAHIMCDPTYKSWQTIELFAALEDSKKRAARFREARPTKGKNFPTPGQILIGEVSDVTLLERAPL